LRGTLRKRINGRFDQVQCLLGVGAWCSACHSLVRISVFNDRPLVLLFFKAISWCMHTKALPEKLEGKLKKRGDYVGLYQTYIVHDRIRAKSSKIAVCIIMCSVGKNNAF
jgi:hypothetical protein